jgi:ribosomal-protein-alanine N-acetyltransferase
MTLRRMTAADIRAAAEVETLCFSCPWTARMLQDELAHPFAYYLAAEEDGALVGYGGMRVLFETADITTVACVPAHRRRGTGEAIIRRLLFAAGQCGVEKILLEVRESNLPARCLYDKLGFVCNGRRRGYYEKPREDALLMEKRL